MRGAVMPTSECRLDLIRQTEGEGLANGLTAHFGAEEGGGHGPYRFSAEAVALGSFACDDTVLQQAGVEDMATDIGPAESDVFVSRPARIPNARRAHPAVVGNDGVGGDDGWRAGGDRSGCPPAASGPGR